MRNKKCTHINSQLLVIVMADSGKRTVELVHPDERAAYNIRSIKIMLATVQSMIETSTVTQQNQLLRRTNNTARINAVATRLLHLQTICMELQALIED